MPRILAPLALALIAAPLTLSAEVDEAVEALTDPAAIGDAASQAADELASKAEDKVLASEMIGREITGPDGDTLGEVEDLVVVPGGKVMAVLVRPSDDGELVALPYQALKVSAAAEGGDELGLSLPVDLEEARAIDGMQALTEAATGEGG